MKTFNSFKLQFSVETYIVYPTHLWIKKKINAMYREIKLVYYKRVQLLIFVIQ